MTYSLEKPDDAKNLSGSIPSGKYGDIACYAAMNRRIGAKPPPFNFWAPSTWFPKTGEQLLAQANALWDGVGVNDIVHQQAPNHSYCTFKAALLGIANLKFGVQPNPQYLETCLAMLDSDGGIVTDYLPDHTFAGSKNCESSAFVEIFLNMLSGE